MSEQAPMQTPAPTPTKAQLKRERDKLKKAVSTVVAYCANHPQQLGERSFVIMKDVVIDDKKYGDWYIAVISESTEKRWYEIPNHYIRVN